MKPLEIRMHPSRPYADGICFDDLFGVSDEYSTFLATRGVVFLTEFKEKGRVYGGTVIAPSWPAAEEIAFSRGLDEQVVGVLVEKGESP